MKQSKKLFASVLAIVALFALSVAPASAHQAPDAIVCTGTAEVSNTDTASGNPGITFPGIDDSRNFDFTLPSATSSCTTSAGAAVLTASGNGDGWCGASTASGTGTLTYSDGHVIPFSFTWTSGGSILIVLGDHGGGSAGVLAGAVQASGGADCATVGGATSFDVVITAAAA